jgi:hypothetical protein
MYTAELAEADTQEEWHGEAQASALPALPALDAMDATDELDAVLAAGGFLPASEKPE